MAETNPWRFGLVATGEYIDLVNPEIGAGKSYIESGGSARARGNTLLVDRTGPVKRAFSFTHDRYSPGTDWAAVDRLYRASPGPYELYDPTVPNLLSIDDRLGIGWVTSTGTAVTAQTNTRLAISASPATVQTAITASPAAANLTAVTPSTTYVACTTVDTASSYTGTLDVYGYTSTPSGSGTLQGTVALTAAGRYSVSFTTGGTIAYVEFRYTRSAGSASLVDPALWYGTADMGPSITRVMFRTWAAEVMDLTAFRSNWTSTMEEI